MKTQILTTSFADIAVAESEGAGPAVLLLHGNSACKDVFRRQFESPLAARYRLIAIDLPGHGGSSDAHDPARGYVLPGYASAAAEVLRRLGVSRVVAFGWSLGGHIALDMISKVPGLAGVMISGAPPVPGGPEGIAMGFQLTPTMALTGAQVWSDADAETYARATIGPNAPFEPFMLEAARRTDGRAREIFLSDVLARRPDDQRRIAETSRVPLAIVNGADDPFVVASYFGAVRYANLWEGEVHVLPGVGHAPFWESPDRFNPLLERFLASVAR